MVQCVHNPPGFTGYHKVIDSIKAPWLWVKSMLSVLNLPGLFQGGRDGAANKDDGLVFK